MKKFLFLLTLFIPFSFQAQEISIDSVVIVGRILPSTINKVDENYTIVTKREIQASPAQSVEELLATYSGLDIRRRGIHGMQSDISLRGGTFEQVLLLINGVRMTDAQTAHNMMKIPVNMNDIDRVEIIKGPAARRYGANAYSGVINIITTPSRDNKIEIHAKGGSYGTYEAGIVSDFTTSNWSHKVHASYGASDGYRYNTDYEKIKLFYQTKTNISDGNLSLQAGFGQWDFGANGFYASPLAIDQYEEIQTSIVSATYNKMLTNWSWNAEVFWRRGQDMYLFKRQDPSFYRNMHIGNNVGAEFTSNINSKLGVTGLGASYRRESLASSNLGDLNRDIITLIADHNFSFFQDKFNITPGISWTNYADQGDFFYPGLDMGYSLNKYHKLYAHVARVHRIPSYTELYYVSSTDQGNSELDPESAVSAEIGYRYHSQAWMTKFSLFIRDSEHVIDWVKDSEGETWKSQNVGDILTQGIEVNITRKFSGIFKKIAVDYTYLYTDVDQYANFSRYANNNLRHQFIARIDNRITERFHTQLSYRFLDRVTLDNYSLLDLKLQYTTPQWQCFIALNNLLSTQYQEANLVPMPGIWFTAGGYYSFNFDKK